MQIFMRWKPASRPTSRLAEYVSPVEPAPRTVILEPGFAETRRVKVFGQGWDESVARSRPAVIAASAADLIRLAQRWESEWERPTHFLVILSRADTGLATVEERDLLWDAFGLPVFEQVLDVSNHLLAYECDAHDGVHIRRAGLRLDGCFPANSACGCGDPAPRLLALPAQAYAMAHRAAEDFARQ
jgi:hypothetical protein